jgi:hypothetical protein
MLGQGKDLVTTSSRCRRGPSSLLSGATIPPPCGEVVGGSDTHKVLLNDELSVPCPSRKTTNNPFKPKNNQTGSKAIRSATSPLIEAQMANGVEASAGVRDFAHRELICVR